MILLPGDSTVILHQSAAKHMHLQVDNSYFMPEDEHKPSLGNTFFHCYNKA